jgi:hypothetical protein
VSERRAQVHAAWEIQRALRSSIGLRWATFRQGDLGRLLDLPTNLLAHHLGVLEAAGHDHRTRSEGDRRRAYLRLDAGRSTEPVASGVAIDVPSGVHMHADSARSQLAAAALAARSSCLRRRLARNQPIELHPRAVKVGRRHGLHLSGIRPLHVRDVLRDDDLVISVCDARTKV